MKNLLSMSRLMELFPRRSLAAFGAAERQPDVAFFLCCVGEAIEDAF